MKILYLITKSNWGGAQKHVFDLATAMRDKNHDVKVILGGEGELKTRLTSAGIFTYSISSMGRDVSVTKDSESLSQIFSTIRNQKPDVLHLHSPKAAGLGAFCGRLLRVKNIVMTVHGWTWNESRPFHQRAGIIFFSWLTAILCHKVIVICKRDYDQAMRLPWIKEKLVLIPLGLRPIKFYSVDGAKQFIAKSVNIPIPEFSKKIVLGTIAELHPNKGLEYLVQSMSHLVERNQNIISVVISGGQEKERLEMMIQEKKLEKNMFLLGQIPDAAEYMKAFSLFVLPSIKEGLPYVLLEAGAASTPVISTSVGGIPEIIHDMHSGILVQPKNTRELTHAIAFAIEHPTKMKAYGKALNQKIAADFKFDDMIYKVEEAYKVEAPKVIEVPIETNTNEVRIPNNETITNTQ